MHYHEFTRTAAKTKSRARHYGNKLRTLLRPDVVHEQSVALGAERLR